MTKEQAMEILKKHKEQIDKKYINTRNSKAIETVLSMLKEKDKQIDLMAEAMRYYNGMQQEQEFCIEICEKKECNIEKCKDCIKQYFENKAKELLNK
jgi:hypothetical protein